MLESGGQNQKWHRSGQGGYITPAALGFSNAPKQGTKSKVVHKRAVWLNNPCHLGGSLMLQSGRQSRIGPQVGRVAT